MSVDHIVRLVCDYNVAETCTNAVGDGPRSFSVRDVRRIGRVLGWARIDDRLDMCPSCATVMGLRRKRPYRQ